MGGSDSAITLDRCVRAICRYCGVKGKRKGEHNTSVPSHVISRP